MGRGVKGVSAGAGDLLHHHLRHDVEGGEARAGEALLVLPHLDGLQPLVHGIKAGVVGDRAVQQRQVDAGVGWATVTVRGCACGEHEGRDLCACIGKVDRGECACVRISVSVYTSLCMGQ